jgi:hypothetical protein
VTIINDLADEYHVKTFPSDSTELTEMEMDDLECDLIVFHPYRTLLTLCGKGEAWKGMESIVRWKRKRKRKRELALVLTTRDTDVQGRAALQMEWYKIMPDWHSLD